MRDLPLDVARCTGLFCDKRALCSRYLMRHVRDRQTPFIQLLPDHEECEAFIPHFDSKKEKT